MTSDDAIGLLLRRIYGDDAPAVEDSVRGLMQAHATALPKPMTRRSFSQADAVLITYADTVVASSETPLQALKQLLHSWTDVINTVHLLPFFPYSSDDGFSVIDYLSVRPEAGTWSDIENLGQDFGLMFDLVANHVSAESQWFQSYLADDEEYADLAVDVDPSVDLSSIVRPRTSPLLTPVQTASGVKHVWTTFSADQIDLNYENPMVLIRMLDVLLTYVSRGASIVRLDAVTYLWKEIGTSGVHHPKTHAVVQLMRAVLDEMAPQVTLITETNVPHAENISYFGDGHNEAQLVYNFALPPLVLHTFSTGDASVLKSWAADLDAPGEGTFFNFLASHDGIGVRGVEGILPATAIDDLVTLARRRGAVSVKDNGDGTHSPYELNVNLFDVLAVGIDDPDQQIDRFIGAHAIMLALRGVPAIYVHSFFGSLGDPDAAKATGINRSINRGKLELTSLQAELADPTSRRRRVVDRLAALLTVRQAEPAFAPQSPMCVDKSAPGLLALRRGEGAETIWCVQNVTALEQIWNPPAQGIDLLSGQISSGEIKLPAHGSVWLKRL